MNIGLNLLIALMNLAITVHYCRLTIQRKISPSLAMWVFFTIAVAMSLITYYASGTYTFWDNVYNATDLILVGSVSVCIAIFGDHHTRFSRFDLGCLAAVLGLVVFWIITQNHIFTNLSVQTIMVIAYAPVVRRLWRAEKNTEPFLPWIGIFLTPVVSLFVIRGSLAVVYALRAMVCTATLMLLMLHVEVRRTRRVRS